MALKSVNTQMWGVLKQGALERNEPWKPGEAAKRPSTAEHNRDPDQKPTLYRSPCIIHSTKDILLIIKKQLLIIWT